MTLAPLVVSALTPFLTKGAEKIVEKTAEAGFEQRGKIWNLVKGMFAEDDLTLLNLFEQNPEDAKTQGKIEGKLEERLKANPDIAAQLESLLKAINQTSVDNAINNSVNINRQDGENNFNAQGNQNSSFTFNPK